MGKIKSIANSAKGKATKAVKNSKAVKKYTEIKTADTGSWIGNKVKKKAFKTLENKVVDTAHDMVKQTVKAAVMYEVKKEAKEIMDNGL